MRRNRSHDPFRIIESIFAFSILLTIETFILSFHVMAAILTRNGARFSYALRLYGRVFLHSMFDLAFPNLYRTFCRLHYRRHCNHRHGRRHWAY
jgi:hypothetical protein